MTTEQYFASLLELAGWLVLGVGVLGGVAFVTALLILSMGDR